jgi:hypothetical protein
VPSLLPVQQKQQPVGIHYPRETSSQEIYQLQLRQLAEPVLAQILQRQRQTNRANLKDALEAQA